MIALICDKPSGAYKQAVRYHNYCSVVKFDVTETYEEAQCLKKVFGQQALVHVLFCCVNVVI